MLYTSPWSPADRQKFEPLDAPFTLIGYRFQRPHSETHETLEDAIEAGLRAMQDDTWAAYEVIDRAGRTVATREDIVFSGIEEDEGEA